ncbi:phosphatidylinositol 3-kinase catalytic subunit type 3-like [Pluvialis apricaria]
MDTYVKSCASYCVITYILGVGDRYLDNLLLTKTGKLFHTDFGYILGRDPKPLPLPMKLNKEMVEGMGGTQSEQSQEFRKQCYTAFLHIRSYSNLIFTLFSLMVDAKIPDIALEPDQTVKKVQDKFRLDLSDEEAVHYMQSLIDESVHALCSCGGADTQVCTVLEKISLLPTCGGNKEMLKKKTYSSLCGLHQTVLEGKSCRFGSVEN